MASRRRPGQSRRTPLLGRGQGPRWPPKPASWVRVLGDLRSGGRVRFIAAVPKTVGPRSRRFESFPLLQHGAFDFREVAGPSSRPDGFDTRTRYHPFG